MAPRSNGATLHVDFENYVDGLIGVLNAGVRWVGHPFAKEVKQKIVTIARDRAVAFSGERCAQVLTDQHDQLGRIVLQPRFDAPVVEDLVAEFVFRPVADGDAAAVLEDFVVWSASDASGAPAGVTLLANGDASSGTYRIDVEFGDFERADGVVCDLDQRHWVRFVLEQKKAAGVVKLWAGTPGFEQVVGSFSALDANAQVQRVEFGDLYATHGRGSGYWDDVLLGDRLSEDEARAPAEIVKRVGETRSQATQPVVVTSVRQLFVDDALVQSAVGIRRTQHAARKFAENPLLKPETPLELACKSILPVAVLRDTGNGAFRCWYGVWGTQLGLPTYVAVASSADGVHWMRPELGVFEYQGSSANNLIRQGRMFRPQYDAVDPDPSQRYKAIIRDAGFLAAFSPDGLRWRTTTPVLDQAYDATSVHWDPVGNRWIASCKIWCDGARARGYAESNDFINWSDTYYMFAADSLDHPKDQVYSMSIVRYESIYLGLIKMYHLESDRCDVQIAYSRDAKHWERPDRTPFIPNGETPADWDYGNLDPPDQIHPVNDELLLYYSGRSTLHNELPNDGALGGAKLRRDGFVSLDAGEQGGMVVTRQLVLRGRELHLNADVARGGSVIVEILDGSTVDTKADEADVARYPFIRENAIPIETDSVDHHVQWINSVGLHVLRGQPVRLRLTIQNARVYSIWTT